jgi:hypothetical protein
MAKKDKSVKQKAESRGNLKQVAGDNHETTTTNANIFVGIFFVLVLALGGIAWAVTIGLNHGGQTPQVEQKSRT